TARRPGLTEAAWRRRARLEALFLFTLRRQLRLLRRRYRLERCNGLPFSWRRYSSESLVSGSSVSLVNYRVDAFSSSESSARNRFSVPLLTVEFHQGIAVTGRIPAVAPGEISANLFTAPLPAVLVLRVESGVSRSHPLRGSATPSQAE